MIIGVPKEIKEQEYRVAMLPSGVYQLVKRGHQVVVERGAGAGAGYPDSGYEQAGAKLIDAHAGVGIWTSIKMMSNVPISHSARASWPLFATTTVCPCLWSNSIEVRLERQECRRQGIRLPDRNLA